MIRNLPRLTSVVATTVVLTLPLGAQGDAILVRGGTINTATGAPITNGSILIRAGKIVAV